LTAKKGFIYGLALAVIYFFVALILINVGFPMAGIITSYLFAGLVFVSLSLPVASLFKGKEILGTTIGGGVFGFTAFYQVFYIIATIWQGSLPCF